MHVRFVLLQFLFENALILIVSVRMFHFDPMVCTFCLTSVTSGMSLSDEMVCYFLIPTTSFLIVFDLNL